MSDEGITYGEDSRDMWRQIGELRETLPQAWEALYTMACKMQELERKIEGKSLETPLLRPCALYKAWKEEG